MDTNIENKENVGNDTIHSVSNRTCENCFYRTYNTTSRFKHDEYFCTAGRHVTTITNIKTHTCNKWMEI